jgi:hypothetical protein
LRATIIAIRTFRLLHQRCLGWRGGTTLTLVTRWVFVLGFRLEAGNFDLFDRSLDQLLDVDQIADFMGAD